MTAPHAPAAVLWDMDGTLIDSEPAWMAAETVLAAQHGVTWTHADGLAMVGNALRVTAEALQQRGVDMEADKIVASLLSSVTARVREGVPWHADARALLDRVRTAGIPCALVTASHTMLASAVLAEVPGVFATIVTGDEDMPGKPDPAPYLEAARRLGVDIGSCVVIEDSPAGTEAGYRSGALTVGVRREAHFEHRDGMVVLSSLEDVTVDDLTAWLWAQDRAQAPRQR